MKAVFTIGYQGSTLPMVLSILKVHQVTDLIDIRRYNWSKLSPFNKNALSILLSEHGITYIEEKRLAPSITLLRWLEKGIEEGRKKKNEPATMNILNAFNEKYLLEIGEEGLRVAIDLMDRKEKPCLLCWEEYARLNLCHRKVLCDQIAKSAPDMEFQFIHLKEWDFSGEKLKEMKLWQGINYNLLSQFEKLNEKYFSGLIGENDIFLVWEAIPKRPKGQSLGYFRPPNYIALNKLLDNLSLPIEFIDSVLYHELLHYKRLHDGKTPVHTEEFYYEFFAFEEYHKIFGFDVATVKSAMGRIIETADEVNNDVSVTTSRII